MNALAEIVDGSISTRSLCGTSAEANAMLTLIAPITTRCPTTASLRFFFCLSTVELEDSRSG